MYYFPQKPFPKEDVLVWKGQLTPYQENISQGMLKAIAAKKDLLVHAVTGDSDVYSRNIHCHRRRHVVCRQHNMRPCAYHRLAGDAAHLAAHFGLSTTRLRSIS